jgi:two-component system, cell cycle sensor histidine kinase and response regulator CckA
MERQSRRLGLKWKIGGIYTLVMFILGICVIAAVYELTGSTLRDQLDRRSLAIARNFSDAAAGYVAGRNTLALNALAGKYTLNEGVAYAYVEDGQGEILAQTFGRVPEDLQSATVPVTGREVGRHELRWNGRTIYETSVPVLEGQMGKVHVGFWADDLDAEIQRALIPIIAAVAVVPFVGALLSFILAHWLVQPIVGLTRIADKVTMGDLETSVGGNCVSAGDEIGDLARALERMRSSLKAAMLRLGRDAA